MESILKKKKLPIGIQSFEKIRTENYYYVDKTEYIYKLVNSGGSYYFLSRPRRFGKSLFLDTIKQAFLGKKELFQGLFLENNWNWDEKYPVIHISFGKGLFSTHQAFLLSLQEIFMDIEKEHHLKLDYPSFAGKLWQAIRLLNERTGKKVVVLVDEYDKPILDCITNREIAKQNREELKNIYSVLKDADPYLKFVFLTGV
ncbi:MAG: AAA family ATPase, partial [Thermoplasmata archaeon]